MMKNHQVCVAIITTFALVSALAIIAPLTQMATPLRFLATFGGILLGPGGLAYRLATRLSWPESLTIGVAINVAIVMLLALLLVSVHLWHPIQFELLLPITTFVLSCVLLRKELRGSSTRRR